MSATPHHRAQDIGAALPPLLIEAERVAQAVQQGVHGRRRSGSGETFWQFRRYEQGDPVERIDWRQSARTDAVFIREREWEAAQTAFLWADTSGSMQYASAPNLSAKAERAQLLMLALASLLLRGGERVAWLGNEVVTAHGKQGLAQIAARLHEKTNGNLPPDLRIARDGHMILCSDFLMPPHDLTTRLKHYAAMRVKGVLLHVLDPAENDFPLQGRLDIQGLENEAPLLAPNAASLRDTYNARMTEHKDRLQHMAAAAGWVYLTHITDQSPQQSLLQLYQALARDA